MRYYPFKFSLHGFSLNTLHHYKNFYILTLLPFIFNNQYETLFIYPTQHPSEEKKKSKDLVIVNSNISNVISQVRYGEDDMYVTLLLLYKIEKLFTIDSQLK